MLLENTLHIYYIYIYKTLILVIGIFIFYFGLTKIGLIVAL
jgi:Na+/H+ antiporter NhaD/arsenite permease-like protein